MVRYRMIYCTQNPYQHLNNLRNPSYDHANLRNPSKGARADTQTTLDICQDPVPSRPGTKYPVRGEALTPICLHMRCTSNLPFKHSYFNRT